MGSLLKILTSFAAAIALAAISASAYAQTFTLDYNDQVTGTFTSLHLSGSLTYTLANGVYILTAEGFNVTGASGTQYFQDEPSPLSYGNGGAGFL